MKRITLAALAACIASQQKLVWIRPLKEAHWD
jgi:hypothetical protein